MKKIGDYLIERLKLNDTSKIKKDDIIKAYEQNHLLFKYGGAIIKAEALWVMIPRIEILEALGKIIDNTKLLSLNFFIASTLQLNKKNVLLHQTHLV